MSKYKLKFNYNPTFVQFGDHIIKVDEIQSVSKNPFCQERLEYELRVNVGSSFLLLQHEDAKNFMDWFESYFSIGEFW